MKIRRFFNYISFIVTFILVFASGCFCESVVSWNTVYKSFQSLNTTECYASENPEVIIAYSSERETIGRLNIDNEDVFFDIRAYFGYDSFEFHLENHSYEDYLSFECISLDKNTMVLKATELSQEKYLKLLGYDKKTNILTLHRRQLSEEEAEFLRTRDIKAG